MARPARFWVAAARPSCSSERSPTRATRGSCSRLTIPVSRCGRARPPTSPGRWPTSSSPRRSSPPARSSPDCRPRGCVTWRRPCTRPKPPRWPGTAAAPPLSTPGPATSSAGRSARFRPSSICAPECCAALRAPPCWPGTRRGRPMRRRASIRSPPRPPRPWRWTPLWITPKTASRSSAGSASPGSMTSISTCAARWPCASCSAGARPGARGPPGSPWPVPAGGWA